VERTRETVSSPGVMAPHAHVYGIAYGFCLLPLPRGYPPEWSSLHFLITDDLFLTVDTCWCARGRVAHWLCAEEARNQLGSSLADTVSIVTPMCDFKSIVLTPQISLGHQCALSRVAVCGRVRQ
jgi:hypothetical protein